jgi:molybdopterin molybdotransferase
MAAELTGIERGRELVLARTRALPGESVPLGDALGRTLAEEVSARERVPDFDNSAMDGYAVRAADLSGAGEQRPARLAVRAESRAGAPTERELGPGEAIAISTGALIPRGADAVVRLEDTRSEAGADREEPTVAILVAVEAGRNVRRAGEDIEPGRKLLGASSTLGPAELGVLASVGVAEPACHRRPRVAFVSTGDELIGVDQPLRPGAVRNSNAYSLPALARAAGADSLGANRAPDQPEAIRRLLESGLGADLLVVSGGVSVGEHDHVKGAFAELGVEQVFWGVSLKPGKPTFFGVRGETLAFGLPGNPVSAYVTFLLFVRPALLGLQGADPGAARIEATLTEPYHKPADRAHAVRCRLELAAEGWLAKPAPQQGSHVMTSLLGADGLALIPAATERVAAGERVTVELLP